VDHTQQLELVIEASLQAGKAIMAIYAQPEISVESKADHSPLTLADQHSNDIILQHLSETGIPVLSEESLNESWEIRKTWEQCWIVDPLDGTKEFIKRNGEFTVNIALAIHGKPVMGVIFAPATGELFYGIVGSGAFKSDLPVKDQVPFSAAEVMEMAKPIPASDETSDLFTIVASRSHRNAETNAYIAGIEKEKESVMTVSRGSSLKICMVAEGVAQVYPRFAPTMEWDTAAGHAIAVAAGCRVFNPETGEPLVYNKEQLKNPWFIVQRV
jgi:3'(2'), 5'-bisphosphate nucleotidase